MTPGDDEEEKDWQPMSKAMSNALENRWIKGWVGDNGTDDFQINVNGCIYMIDTHCMWLWQKGLHSNRGREVRRVQAGHIQKRLVEERDRFQEENNELSESVLKLELLGHEVFRCGFMCFIAFFFESNGDTCARSFLGSCFDLTRFSLNPRHERDALMNSMIDHATQMMLLEAWRMSRQLQTPICSELSDVDGTLSNIQRALVAACPADHHGDCLRMRNFSITRIQKILNVGIWKDYEFRKEKVRKELDGRDSVPAVTGGLPSQACSWAHLDEGINEILLIHGTTRDKINEIANFGFDERLARERGLYGQGVYFTDQSCKSRQSLQYSGAKCGNSGCFIIARAILGHPFRAQGPLKQLKVEPRVDENDPSLPVVVTPSSPFPGLLMVGSNRYTKNLSFDGAQAYPEMIVYILQLLSL